jgi:hypothetical protein
MTKRIEAWLIGMIALLYIVAAFSIAYMGTFSRLIADDYCTANEGLTYGAFGAAIFNYNNWIGLLSTFFVKGLLAPIQIQFTIIQSVVLLVIMGLALFAALYQLTFFLNFNQKFKASGILTILLILIIAYAVPTPRSLYWFATLIPYGYPVALGLVCIALWLRLLRVSSSPYHVLGIVVLFSIFTFIIVTAANTFFPVVAPLALIAILFSLLYLSPQQKRYSVTLYLATLVVAIFSFAIVFLAPGNAVRQEAIAATSGYTPGSVSDMFVVSLSITQQYLAQAQGVASMMIAFVATIVVTYWLHRGDASSVAQLKITSRPYLLILLVLISTAVGIVATVAASVYGVGVVSLHIMFLPRVMQVLAMSMLGYIAAVLMARNGFPNTRIKSRPIFRLTLLALVFMIGALPITIMGYNLSQLTNFQTYAADWDARNAFIKEQVAIGNTGIIQVPPYRFSLATYMNLEEVDDQPGFAEGCAAAYYGVQQIQVVESSS